MYVGDIPRDTLTLQNAKRMPGAKLFRHEGRLYLKHGRDIYVWQPTPGGLGELDGFFSKLTKPFKKIFKIVKKISKPISRVVRSVGRGVRPLAAKLAPLAPALAFIPGVGTALAAGVALSGAYESRKRAKTEAEAYAAEEQIQQAEIASQEAQLAVQRAGLDQEFQRALVAHNAGRGEQYASGAGGGRSGGGYGGEGEATGEGQVPTYQGGFDAQKLIVPGAIALAIVLLMKRK